MTRKLRRAWSESGFGLVSVLFALVLLGIGAAALANSTMFVVSARTEGSVRATAAAIAATYLEKVKTRNFSTLGSEAPVCVNEAGEEEDGAPFVRTLTVTEVPDVEETKLLAVSVRYPSGLGRSRRVELVTMVYYGSWQDK